MIGEWFAIIIGLVWLTLIGLGPSLYLNARSSSGVLGSISMSPAIALCLLGILSFPLARYFAPLQNSFGIATGILLFMSLSLAVSYFLPRKEEFTSTFLSISFIKRVGLVFSCIVLLGLPMLIGGIQHAVFLSNNSDTFFFMSFADSFRVADWQTVMGGAQGMNDVAGMQKLADASPTALFTARFLLLPLALGSSLVFSWISFLVDVPVYRFFYAYHVICYVCVFMMTILIGKEFKFSSLLNYLSALIVSTGSFAYIVLKSDQSAQILGIPVSLLAFYAWICLDRDHNRFFSRAGWLWMLSLAFFLCSSLAYPAILGFAVIIYFGMKLINRDKIKFAFSQISFFSICSVLTLLVTGQLTYIARCYMKFFDFLSKRTFSQSADIFARSFGQHEFLGFWGLTPLLEFLARKPKVLMIAEYGLVVLFSAMTFFCVVTFFRILKKRESHELILVSYIVCGFALFAMHFLGKSYLSALKDIEYIYPFISLFVVVMLGYWSYQNSILSKGVRWMVFGWIFLQLGLTSLLNPLQAIKQREPGAHPKKLENYDLSRILDKLDEIQPQQLLISTPKDKSWSFPFYVMFAFRDFKPFFQSGLIFDNSVRVKNHYLQKLEQTPDYAVVSKADDYIRTNQLGEKIEETEELALYQIASNDKTHFMNQR